MEYLNRNAVAIVTGGAGGIGLAIVSALAQSGVKVACWDRAGADFSRVDAVCHAAGVEFAAIPVDVRDREACRAAAQRSAELGTVRYGVNCAGIDHLQPTHETATDDWQRVLDVNLSGVLFSCLAQREVMRAGGGGRAGGTSTEGNPSTTTGTIVNIASMSGLIVNRDCLPHAAYSSSKAGVAHLSKCLAVEWAPESIRVNTVSPGYTRTEMTAHNSDELNQAFINQSPMKRMAEVEEIAGPVLFLLGSASSYVTGVNLPVDGGVLLW